MRLHKYTLIKIIVRKLKYLQMDQKILFQEIQQFLYAFLILKLEMQKGQVIIYQFTQQK